MQPKENILPGITCENWQGDLHLCVFKKEHIWAKILKGWVGEFILSGVKT